MKIRTKSQLRNNDLIAVRIPTEMRQRIRSLAEATNAISEAEVVRYIISSFFSDGCQHDVERTERKDEHV